SVEGGGFPGHDEDSRADDGPHAQACQGDGAQDPAQAVLARHLLHQELKSFPSKELVGHASFSPTSCLARGCAETEIVTTVNVSPQTKSFASVKFSSLKLILVEEIPVDAASSYRRLYRNDCGSKQQRSRAAGGIFSFCSSRPRRTIVPQ